ncbi:hypothetical protein RFI_03841 [Reticulomyxa filosa]|uniref:Mediator of RNA polymerase II transcription subunit 7 n=1 Tax=Reticulomyxa filosa TaxID=46433 RepID=X6P4Z6_RETFI|nr:hypothetical protein RFI_03841 [Reticulomyxa filosa]|eukprot:ETO33266.1 hypothetical protein RFI_03841 [Reticulomyxa filosa]
MTTNRQTYPPPPFFYNFFDESEGDTYEELSVPPAIPKERCIFSTEENDVIATTDIDPQIMHKPARQFWRKLTQQKSEVETEKKEEAANMANIGNVALGMNTSRMQPHIQSHCNKLQSAFVQFRNVLNYLRAHQAKQTLIQSLKNQLKHKYSLLEEVHKF